MDPRTETFDILQCFSETCCFLYKFRSFILTGSARILAVSSSNLRFYFCRRYNLVILTLFYIYIYLVLFFCKNSCAYFCLFFCRQTLHKIRLLNMSRDNSFNLNCSHILFTAYLSQIFLLFY